MEVKLTKSPEVSLGKGSADWSKGETTILFEVRDETGFRGRIQVSTSGIRWWKGKGKTVTRHRKWPELLEDFDK